MAKQLFLIVSLLGNVVWAQDAALKLSRDELLSLLPGTKVTHISSSGSERHWSNDADGTLYARTDNKAYGSLTGSQGAGQAGKWRVDEAGKYCVEIDWKRAPTESWCSFILKGDGDTYYLNRIDEKRKITFAKP